jgi:hypothetical protein
MPSKASSSARPQPILAASPIARVLFFYAVALCVFPSRPTQASPRAAESAPREETACLAIQGNGDLFASLLGQAVALLERGVRPLVTSGGSSGSVVAVLLQSLLANSSVAASQARGADGRRLTLAQKAAVVRTSRASSPSPMRRGARSRSGWHGRRMPISSR